MGGGGMGGCRDSTGREAVVRGGGQGQEKRVWCGRFVGDGVGFKRYHTIWKISEEGLESSAAARSEHFGFERLPGEAGPGDSIFLFP